MEGYDATTYGERWADVYDAWYDDPAETGETVAFLADLAGPPAGAGTIVELGVGTGRLALPLAARGYDVRGVDASPAMVERLRAKPGGPGLPVVVGDMGAVPVPPANGEAAAAGSGGTGEHPAGTASCGGVFVAYNTFFGLPGEDAQRRCLARVHEVLRPGGWFVLAAFVPGDPDDDEAATASRSVGLRSMTADHVVLTADVHDRANQTVSGQFIDIAESGVRLRPFHIHYRRPAELDALARSHGLDLVERWGSWTRAPFDDAATMHVSVYRRPAGPGADQTGG